MAVATRKIAIRRSVHYTDLNDFLADAERMAASGAQTIGNWTLAQIFDHLTRSLTVAVEGTDAFFPAPARLVLRFWKTRIISRPMKPGFNCPKRLTAVLRPSDGLTTAEALDNLEAAVERFQKAPSLASHPAFGPMTRDEWTQITLRHAELHMSFAGQGRALHPGAVDG